MSVPASTTPAAPAETTSASPEPASTRSIIESSIADLPDRGDEGGDTSDNDIASDTPVASDGQTAPNTQQTTTPAEELDELAAALGIVEKGKGKWTARVAYSKVNKAVKELQAKLKADHDAAITGHTTRIGEFQRQIAAFDALVESPERLLSELARVNPAYARFAGQPAGSTTDNTPQRIESVEDLQKLIDRQVSDRIAPYERERQTRAVIEQALPRVRQQLAEAEKLPLFTESKSEILTVLQKNPQMGLNEAYMSVVVPKLAANHDQIRQKTLSELNERPHSTTVTSTVSGRSVPDGDGAARSTGDIIRDTIRKNRQ